MNAQAFSYAKQFTDNVFKAQAAMLKGFEQAAGLQIKALEQQTRAAAEFVGDAMEIRDPEAFRGLWEKGVALQRDGAERQMGLARDLMGVFQSTNETLGALVGEVQAAPAAAAKKAAKAS